MKLPDPQTTVHLAACFNVGDRVRLAHPESLPISEQRKLSGRVGTVARIFQRMGEQFWWVVVSFPSRKKGGADLSETFVEDRLEAVTDVE